MEIRILLSLFLITLLVTNDASAARHSSRGSSRSSSRSYSSGSRWRGSSSGHTSSHSFGHGTSSGGHTTGSHPSAGSSGSRHTTGSLGHGTSSGGHTIGSHPPGSSSGSGHTTGSLGHGTSSGGHTTGLHPPGGSSGSGHTTGSLGHGTSSGGHMTGSNPTRHGHGTTSSEHIHRTGQTSHQQNKDSSTSLLHAEGGGLTRPQTYPGSQTGKTGFTTDTRQNSPYNPSAPYKPSAPHNPSAPYNPSASHNPSAPYNPSAPHNPSAPYNPSAPHNPSAPYNPSAPHNPSAPYNPSAPHNPSVPHADSKSTAPLQNHAPTSFGQPNAPSNPSWSNPHFNPSQPHPSNPASSNIGFKEHLRPTSMPIPQQGAPYPRPPYPIHSSSYPSSHPISHTNQPHFTHHNPSQTIGHPSSYPAHIPPPVPGTFGNPYSTHPAGTGYGSPGHGYYPQQHFLSQPAAQPYIPGQTVIMVPGQQSSGRGFGQLMKEALVFSTVNVGVNRLLNPHHHYDHHYDHHYSRPVDSSRSPTSETHITYNNHYFNGAPDQSPPVPASPYGPSQGNIPGTYPAGYPNPVNNPVITPGVSTPLVVGNNNSAIYPNAPSGNPSVAGVSNNMNGPPLTSSNGATGNAMNDQGAPAYFPQYKVSDNDLWALTEELFAKQEVDISKYVTVYLQSKSENVTDVATVPLFYAQQEVYNYPTIWTILALYDNYEHNSTIKETRSSEKRKEQDLLLDVFLNTNVMARAMQWLSDRGFINPDDFERKETLRHIWFSQFDGATSGFERVFTSERYGQDLLGVQDWIYFNYQESKNRIKYMGYVDKLQLGENASLLKLNFKMDDIVRPNATIFVGTLPELEMSLYTICFYARSNDLCPVSLGGAKFHIFTHSFRYYGKDLIDLALPIF